MSLSLLGALSVMDMEEMSALTGMAEATMEDSVSETLRALLLSLVVEEEAAAMASEEGLLGLRFCLLLPSSIFVVAELSFGGLEEERLLRGSLSPVAE